MKVRSGFVSNSSSSSFILVGAEISIEDIIENMSEEAISEYVGGYSLRNKRIKPNSNKELARLLLAENNYSLRNNIRDHIMQENEKEFETYSSYDGIVLGLSVEEMKKDQTLNEFKKHVRSLLADIIPKNHPIGFIACCGDSEGLTTSEAYNTDDLVE